MKDEKHVIFDPDRQQFWKRNKHGYTDSLDDALTCSLEEALEICSEPNVKDYPIPYATAASSQVRWWAYRHVNGEIIVKRLLDERDPILALESDFVERTSEPYTAKDRKSAAEKAATLL